MLDWFYGGLFETFWNGQTPGKKLLGIRVLQANGEPINGMQAVVRNIIRYADLMPIIMPFGMYGGIYPLGLLGMLTPMFNNRYQRWGDLVCGTIVVIEKTRLAA